MAKTRIHRNDYIFSVRIPSEWGEWIDKFAEKWNVPSSYIYRSALREFIAKQKMTSN